MGCRVVPRGQSAEGKAALNPKLGWLLGSLVFSLSGFIRDPIDQYFFQRFRGQPGKPQP